MSANFPMPFVGPPSNYGDGDAGMYRLSVCVFEERSLASCIFLNDSNEWPGQSFISFLSLFRAPHTGALIN